MANVTYNWNPFNEDEDCLIPMEAIKLTGSRSNETVPRAAPFFATGFKLYGSDKRELTLGKDYAFAHPFKNFIAKYNRNVFGSIIILSHVRDTVVYASYSTIGGPFILDETVWKTTLANILNNDRKADWSQLVNVPKEFPPDPHRNDLKLTYDYLDMVEFMMAMVGAINNVDSKEQVFELLALCQYHLNAINLARAHIASPVDIGLGNVQNVGLAEEKDFVGNSHNLLLTVGKAKALFKKMFSGEIK